MNPWEMYHNHLYQTKSSLVEYVTNIHPWIVAKSFKTTTTSRFINERSWFSSQYPLWNNPYRFINHDITIVKLEATIPHGTLL